MKKVFLVANVIMLALILMFDICYMFQGGLLFKSIASIMFVTTGIINIMYCIKNKVNLRYPIWMIVALVFAMLGDILLNINFYAGVVAFAVGHIFYFVSYCMLAKINRRDFLYTSSIAVGAILIILFTPFLDFGGALMQGVCCIYAVIIALMVGKAVSNFVGNKNQVNLIIAIGSVLFFVSDLMLMLDKFGDVPLASYLCLGTYYPAQFILAFSVLSYGAMKHSK